MPINIGKVSAASVNIVDGVQNNYGALGQSHTEQLVGGLNQAIDALRKVSERASSANDSGLAENALEAAGRLTEARDEVSNEPTKDSRGHLNAYLDAADSVLKAAKQAYQDLSPVIESAMPILASVKNLLWRKSE
jgi:hypothetical protein